MSCWGCLAVLGELGSLDQLPSRDMYTALSLMSMRAKGRVSKHEASKWLSTLQVKQKEKKLNCKLHQKLTCWGNLFSFSNTVIASSAKESTNHVYRVCKKKSFDKVPCILHTPTEAWARGKQYWVMPKCQSSLLAHCQQSCLEHSFTYVF